MLPRASAVFSDLLTLCAIFLSTRNSILFEVSLASLLEPVKRGDMWVAAGACYLT